jgi:hypothetical protein
MLVRAENKAHSGSEVPSRLSTQSVNNSVEIEGALRPKRRTETISTHLVKK